MERKGDSKEVCQGGGNAGSGVFRCIGGDRGLFRARGDRGYTVASSFAAAGIRGAVQASF